MAYSYGDCYGDGFRLANPCGGSVCKGCACSGFKQSGFIAQQIKRFVIEAPRIARKHQAGQFVILRLHEQGERIPLTIESSNAERGIRCRAFMR